MIALGCDHGGYELKLEIKKYLDEKGIEYKDYGCDSLDSVDYPVYAKKVAHAILDGSAEQVLEFLLQQIRSRESELLSVRTVLQQKQPDFTMMPIFLLSAEEL